MIELLNFPSNSLFLLWETYFVIFKIKTAYLKDKCKTLLIFLFSYSYCSSLPPPLGFGELISVPPLGSFNFFFLPRGPLYLPFSGWVKGFLLGLPQRWNESMFSCNGPALLFFLPFIVTPSLALMSFFIFLVCLLYICNLKNYHFLLKSGHVKTSLEDSPFQCFLTSFQNLFYNLHNYFHSIY